MKAEVYHTAITVLLDISEECPEAHVELYSALQFLKRKRLEALHDDVIPPCCLTVRNPAFHKKDELQNPTT